MFSLTSFQFSSAGSFLKLAGNVPAGVHGPLMSVAFSHVLSLRRKYVALCSNRSQFVFTAYLRSLSLIGLQIGSPSIFTMIAGFLLKKIGGGSAFTPSWFFGTIWLLSILASTRSSAMTRSSLGMALSIPLTMSRTVSFGIEPKLASAIFRFSRLTSRSLVETLVVASILMVPIWGLSLGLALYDTALWATIDFC